MIETIIECLTTGVVITGVLGVGATIYSSFNNKRMQKHAEMVERLLQDQRVRKVQVGDFLVERVLDLEMSPTASSSNSGTAALTDSSYHTTATDIDIPSPIEEFDIINLIDPNLIDWYLSFTNESFFMLLTLTLVVLLLFHFLVKLVRIYLSYSKSKEKTGDV